MISPKRIGTWNQFPPIWKQEDKKYQIDIFMVQITDMNNDEELRNQIVENSEWAKKYEDDDTYLRQRAVVKVYEKFEFSVADRKAGCIFMFQDGTATEN